MPFDPYRSYPYLSSSKISAAEEAVTTAMWELENGSGSDARVDAANRRLYAAEWDALETEIIRGNLSTWDI